jgi:hypothetical protein
MSALPTTHLDAHKSECRQSAHGGQAAGKIRRPHEPIALDGGPVECRKELPLTQSEPGTCIGTFRCVRTHRMRLFDEATVDRAQSPTSLQATVALATPNQRQECAASGTTRSRETIHRDPRCTDPHPLLCFARSQHGTNRNFYLVEESRWEE